MFRPPRYMLNESSFLNFRRAYLATIRLSFARLHGRRETYREPITSKAVTKSMLARLKSSIFSILFAPINPLIHRTFQCVHKLHPLNSFHFGNNCPVIPPAVTIYHCQEDSRAQQGPGLAPCRSKRAAVTGRVKAGS
jgi:hypothetical protein